MVDTTESAADSVARRLAEAERECARLRAELVAERRRRDAWLDYCPDGYLWTDLAGVIREANRAAGVLLGLSPDELVGQPLPAVLAVPALDQALARLGRGKVADLGLERVSVRGEGGGSVSLCAAVVYGADGQVEGVCWLIRDLGESERLLAQSLRDREATEALAALLEQERELLSTIMAHTEAQLAYLDRHFRFVRVNAAYERGSGYSRQALIGRNHFDLFPNPENQAIFERARDSGQPVSLQARPFVFPGRPEMGTTYWDWTLTPIADGEGAVQGLVLSLVDVTARVRREQEGEAHLARLEALLRVSQEVLAEATVEGVMQRVVDAARALTGARLATAGHRYQEGAFRVAAVSRAAGAPPCPPGEQFQMLRGGTYQLLLGGSPTLRLSDEALRAHSRWQGLPEGHVPLRGLLGARLEGVGDAYGMLMVSDKAEGEFGVADEVLLAQLAALTSLALRQIEAREEAERRATELEGVFDAMIDGVMVYDRAGVPLRANQTAADLFGLDPLGGDRDALRKRFQLRHGDGRPAALDELASSRALAGEKVPAEPYRFVDGEGIERVIWASGAPLPGGGAVVVWHDVTALEGERARLAAIINHAPAGIVVTDAEGRLALVNPTADRLHQRPAPYGQPYESHAQLQLVHPDGTPYDPRDLPLVRAALDGETAEEVELGIVWPDGQRRDLLVNTAPIRGPGGGILGAVGMFEDVTERKRTAARARRYAERLRILHETDQAIRAAPAAEEMAQAVVDRVRRLVEARHVTVTLFDLAAGEMSLLAGRIAADEAPAEWQGRLSWIDAALPSLAAGEVYAMPDVGRLSSVPMIEALRRQGVRAYVLAPLLVGGELIGSLNVGLPDPGPVAEEQVEALGELANALAIGIHQARLYAEVRRYADGLERLVRRRTNSLAASEARFRAVFEDAALGIATLDREGRIADSNPALQAMLGFSGAELSGRRLTDFVEGEQRDDDGAFEALIAGRQRFYQAEQRYLRRDGRALDANVTVSLLGTGKGRVRVALAMIEDVTARKQALAAVAQSERLALAGQLATSLAHEINNPLQSVVGCLGLAMEMIDEGGNAGEYMQVAMEELLRASRVVHRLRELGRPLEIKRKRADVNELVQRVLLLTAKRCQEQHIAVKWTPGRGLPLLSLAVDRIQQVFLNVVINALEAMPQGGRLRIDTRPTEAPRGVAVRFADTGTGIPEEDLRTLFEPFFSTKPDGTGLGLYVSQQIAREHGGRIDVQSALGQGTTFTVWLPVE